MSLEGRMGIVAPQPKPHHEVSSSTPLLFKKEHTHIPGKEFQEKNARKLLDGLTTPEELAVQFGPQAMDEIMKAAERISAYESFADAGMPVTTPEPKAPHPLVAIIPSVLDHYTDAGRSEEDEQEYIDLLESLKHDTAFQKILSQYESLIRLYPDRTEEYEMKAMKDFVELNAKLRG